MKELLQEYAAYHVWANQRLGDRIKLLSADLQLKEVASSFTSLHSTLSHLWNAESIWWQRLKMYEVVIAPGTNFKGTTPDVINELLFQNKLWENWIINATTGALEHVFHYQNSKKEKFRQPVYQMLLHLFNHGTYHRGQIVTILRQLGEQSIPATDFIVFSRSKK